MIRALSFALCLAGPVIAQTTGQAWDWQLSDAPTLRWPIQILDLDPENVTAAEVAGLKAQGIFTICYVSVGTTEDWRADAGKFPAEVVGRAYEGWQGENFLDIRRQDILLPIMVARFEVCRAKGFDAIEPDNMDVHINDSGFPITAADAVSYVRRLAGAAQGMGLRIGQKNVPDLTRQLEPHLDFVVTEGCYADGWCGEVLDYARHGKAVLAAEYDVPRGQRAKACAYAAEHGLSMIFKSYDLDSSGSSCP